MGQTNTFFLFNSLNLLKECIFGVRDVTEDGTALFFSAADWSTKSIPQL